MQFNEREIRIIIGLISASKMNINGETISVADLFNLVNKMQSNAVPKENTDVDWQQKDE